MAKKMLIDATHAEETRVVVVDGNKVEEFDFESENKRQLAGNIYLAKVTRVEPSLQAAFVDYGGNRHGFLAFSEIHPDYYQIPVADRQALMEEEAALAAEEEDEDDAARGRSKSRSRRSRSRGKPEARAEKTTSADQTATAEVSEEISGMETIDLGEGDASENGETSTEALTDETPAATEAPASETAEAAPEAEAPEAEGETTEDSAEAAPQEVEAPDEAGAEDDAEGDAKARTDDSIESVADDDTEEDIRPRRKARARKYKIQEVIKVRQIMLVQVVKEERGNKGAALTTYLSLAGRYCVLMPNTARGGGISRKITNATDRSKLKQIAQEIDVPKGAGLIIRTAGAKRTKTEIKRDYEYLQRLWEQIRELTLKSVAPAKIYEEGDLIKRSIRDLYNREIDEVHVEGEKGYRIAKDFMKMIMPSHAKNVKHYVDPMPLFARYQVESYLSSMFNPTVQLKSGGYIVIGVTEALVAIDVNSGRATKEGSIEETALKTNLEAAEEVARQLRLRDLAGLIVIDFIDMDERKNNAAVEKKLKDKLKTDRARIQVGRISGFGLLEMSRQRLRPGMIEATTQPCPACHGTGLIRSDDNMALNILRQIEEEGTRRRSREVLVKCPVGIANYLMNQKREHVAQIEARYGMAVRIEGDMHLVSPDFSMEKFKTATRSVPEVAAPVVSVDTSLMDDIDESSAAEESEAEAEEQAPAAETQPEAEGGNGDESKPKKKRRRRRRSKSRNKDNGNGQDNGNGNGEESGNGDDSGKAEVDAESAEAEQAEAAPQNAEASEAAQDESTKPKKRTRRTRSRAKSKVQEGEGSASSEGDAGAEGQSPATEAEAPAAPAEAAVAAEASEIPAEAAPEAAAARPQPAESGEAPEVAAEPAAVLTDEAETPAPVEESPAEPEAAPVEEAPAEPVAEVAPAPEPEAPADKPAEAEPAPQPAAEEPAPAPQPEPEPAAETANQDEAAKPKRRGWWSVGR
ncbi:Rne/Rng family ribonuclease [Salipiger mucosus]|uniref:Ribonuclease E n=1 Tax=Salipiger mucosus DSM 16094 TaxID=1123237 RepID=S9RPV2_9RHOB|nr:ribonuclease E/G [Salipiger mucosus]EPX76039.1 Ribonuclease E [Salipiger mucosus DSM 16094]